jgi:hypothetical protein
MERRKGKKRFSSEINYFGEASTLSRVDLPEFI